MQTILLLTCLLAAGADPVKSADEPKWRDLFDGKTLAGWKQSGFGGEIDASVEDGKIVLPMAERLSGITYDGKDPLPTSGYEIELEARRVSGTDFFVGLTFPVGKESHASLILGGWGGSVCGISSLDGEDANSNDTRKLMRFKKGQWYKVRLRVDGEQRITAWVDDQQIIDTPTKGKKVNVRGEIENGIPLGLATFATTAEIKSIRLREIKSDR